MRQKEKPRLPGQGSKVISGQPRPRKYIPKIIDFRVPPRPRPRSHSANPACTCQGDYLCPTCLWYDALFRAVTMGVR